MSKLQKKGVQSLKNVIFNSNSLSKFNAECITELKRIRVNIINNAKCKHYLNVNSLVSKFDKLKVIGQGVFDVLITRKTKLNASYPVAQFCINTSQLHIDWIKIKREGG